MNISVIKNQTKLLQKMNPEIQTFASESEFFETFDKGFFEDSLAIWHDLFAHSAGKAIFGGGPYSFTENAFAKYFRPGGLIDIKKVWKRQYFLQRGK